MACAMHALRRSPPRPRSFDGEVIGKPLMTSVRHRLSHIEGGNEKARQCRASSLEAGAPKSTRDQASFSLIRADLPERSRR
jgi:hypothetical protein